MLEYPFSVFKIWSNGLTTNAICIKFKIKTFYIFVCLSFRRIIGGRLKMSSVLVRKL